MRSHIELELRPNTGHATLILISHFTLILFSIVLSLKPNILFWLIGQVLLAFGMLQAFVIMHECGHGTFLPNVRLNKIVGWYAGWVCSIPFPAWRMIHHQHHIWTGWQDIDPTTSQIVPREIKPLERRILNTCWRTGFPLFSILYRLNNYWNAPRLRKIFVNQRQWRTFALSTTLMLTFYLGLIFILGFGMTIQLFAFSNFLHLALCDPILLSQHSHIPQNLSRGRKVTPFPFIQQGVFTRSLRFPRWFSYWILLNFDAHEKHHTYPHIPGYFLDRISMKVENEVHWWEWIRQSKAIPAETLLFKNRNQTLWRF